MNKVIHFKSTGNHRRAIGEKACRWVAKLSAGPSDAELRDLHAWLDENPGHVQALLEAASMWDRVSVLSELSDVFPLDQYLSPRPALHRRFAFTTVVVFALCLLLQGPLMKWLARLGGEAHSVLLSYETRIGEQTTVTLADGSTVILNTNSLIEVAFDESARDVHLHRGEGHFSVARDPLRPFRVYAKGGVVEAVGTAFTVQQLAEQSLAVTVLEGEVNLTRTMPAPPVSAASAAMKALDVFLPDAEPIPLAAGETVEINTADVEVRKQRMQPNELESRLAWRHGMLLFQGDPLDSVIREVSRYTSIRIDVDEAVRDIRVLGYFRTGDIEGVLLTMQDTFHIKVERLSEEHIVLKSGG